MTTLPGPVPKGPKGSPYAGVHLMGSTKIQSKATVSWRYLGAMTLQGEEGSSYGGVQLRGGVLPGYRDSNYRDSNFFRNQFFLLKGVGLGGQV